MFGEVGNQMQKQQMNQKNIPFNGPVRQTEVTADEAQTHSRTHTYPPTPPPHTHARARAHTHTHTHTAIF